MKQMKKLLALLLTLMMVLALAACGSEPEKIVDDPQFEEQVEEEKSFEAGKVEGSTYTSEALGFCFTVGEDWSFLSDEEIGELTGVAQDTSDSETIQAALEDGATLYDVYAMTNDGTGRRINITVTNSDEVFGKLTTEDAYAAAVAEQLLPSLESANAEDVEVETTTYTLAGAEHSGIRINGSIEGVEFYQNVICIMTDKLVYNVTCTAQSEDELTAVMELFKAL